MLLTERENLITYVYTIDGQKLKTSHLTTNFSGTYPLYMTATFTDYIGNLILKNGHPEMLRLDDGYVSFDSDTISGIHYYIQDYMGNNRMVVNGRTDFIEQVTHYYPYGGVIGDISTNESLQPYKFEGKELDRTFGLDNYDIHARQYFAMAPTWDRPDPLANDFPGISPYAYCGGDPVNFGDLNGMNPVYDHNGNYLGDTQEGFTGEVVILDEDANINTANICSMSLDAIQDYAILGMSRLSREACEKVMNHIISKFDNTQISYIDNENNKTYSMVFEMSDQNAKVTYDAEKTEVSVGGGESAPYRTYLDTGNIYTSASFQYEATVENIALSIIWHEWFGHSKNKWGSSSKTHYKCYQAVQQSPIYNQSTQNYKNQIKQWLQIHGTLE